MVIKVDCLPVDGVQAKKSEDGNRIDILITQGLSRKGYSLTKGQAKIIADCLLSITNIK
jgi:hypothetical protein